MEWLVEYSITEISITAATEHYVPHLGSFIAGLLQFSFIEL